MQKRITILGSTGSIGQQTLEIIESYPDKFKIVGLTTNSNIELLKEQILRFSPTHVAVTDEYSSYRLQNSNLNTKVITSEDRLCQIAAFPENDIILNAIVGIAGLKPTMAALEASHDVALANKESLVVAGKLVVEAAKRNNCKIIPVDSEHSAIFQCLKNSTDIIDVRKIFLTASGGPFKDMKFEDFSKISVEQTLRHPKWNMGKKITVDSATLMNKGLEVIEAKWLFDLSPDQIEVVIHPQSVIHSMVEFVDGSIIAQLATTDMRLPILFALTQPDRYNSDLPKLDFLKCGPLTFENPDLERFPCLKYAFNALKIGGSMPVALNAANEVAVDLFLNNKISFLEIPKIIETAMRTHTVISNPSFCDILKVDNSIRSSFT